MPTFSRFLKSQRGSQQLLDSDGYIYSRKKDNAGSRDMVSLGGIKSWSEGVRDKMRREWGILVWSEFWKERVSLNAWGAGEGSCSGELKWSGVAGGNWIGRGTWRGGLEGGGPKGNWRGRGAGEGS